MSEDPIGLAGGINPYVYAGGNPIGGRDPSGLDTETQCPFGWVSRGYGPIPGTEIYAEACEPFDRRLDIVRYYPIRMPGVGVDGEWSEPEWIFGDDDISLGEAIFRSFGGRGSYRESLKAYRETYPNFLQIHMRMNGPCYGSVFSAASSFGTLGLARNVARYAIGVPAVAISSTGRAVAAADAATTAYARSTIAVGAPTAWVTGTLSSYGGDRPGISRVIAGLTPLGIPMGVVGAGQNCF